MEGIKNAVEFASRHGKILLRGLIRMVYGALTAGLFALAVYGFTMITSEAGWTAVCEFIAATATAVVALSCMYAMGASRKRGASR